MSTSCGNSVSTSSVASLIWAVLTFGPANLISAMAIRRQVVGGANIETARAAFAAALLSAHSSRFW